MCIKTHYILHTHRRYMITLRNQTSHSYLAYIQERSADYDNVSALFVKQNFHNFLFGPFIKFIFSQTLLFIIVLKVHKQNICVYFLNKIRRKKKKHCCIASWIVLDLFSPPLCYAKKTMSNIEPVKRNEETKIYFFIYTYLCMYIHIYI